MMRLINIDYYYYYHHNDKIKGGRITWLKQKEGLKKKDVKQSVDLRS